MPYLDHAEASLFYTSQGPASAQPIFLLHGWTCDSHDWSFQIPVLLSHGLRVVALDLRGHGHSSAPQGLYSFDTMAADIVALIQYLGLRDVVLMGHSLSTVLSSIITVQHPELVRALVFVHPIYGLQATAGMAAFHDKVKATPDKAPEMTAKVFNSIMYTPQAPDWIRTWTYRRVLGVPAHSIIGCIAGNAEAVGRLLGQGEACKQYLQRRDVPRLALSSSTEALDWERQIGLGDRDEAVLIAEGTFLQLAVPDKVNRLVIEWLRRIGVISDHDATAKL